MKSKKEIRINFLLLVFLEGFLAVVLEILGVKFLTPFYGNSLQTWTLIIGITITSLTIGYYLGGQLSKRNNKVEILSILILLFSFYLLIFPLFVEKIITGVGYDNLIQGGIISCISILLIPLICIGATNPILIQLMIDKKENSGKISGKVYAVSTVGGVISTLLLGFLIIPMFGVIKPLLFFSVFAFVISLYIAKVKLIYKTLYFLFLFINLGFIFKAEDETDILKIKHVSEGLLGQLKVVDEYSFEDKLSYRYLSINGIRQTNIVNTDEGVSMWNYVNHISMIASIKKGHHKEALLLGMGGGSIANELTKLGFKNDLVDIDKRMFEISEEFFYFKPTNSTYFIDGARHFICKSNKKYDVIVVDILNGEVQPSNFFTLEGISQLKKLLKEDGIIIMEYQEKENLKKKSAYQSLCNTFFENNLKVYTNVLTGEVADIIIVCSKKEINIKESLKKENFSSSAIHIGWVDEFLNSKFTKMERPFKRGILLTDDKPMLDILNAETIANWRKTANSEVSIKQLMLKKKIYY